MDLCTGLYRVGIPNIWSVYIFCSFGYYFDHFGINFMLSRGQMCVTTHTLEMNTTLARFRDPIWCTQSQLTGRIWLCVQYWSPGEPKPILGTPFTNIDFKCWNEIKFVFTQFMLHNPVKWTLVLLVCWYTYHGGSTNAPTWTLYKNSLRSWYRLRVHLRNSYPKSRYFNEFWI